MVLIKLGQFIVAVSRLHPSQLLYVRRVKRNNNGTLGHFYVCSFEA